MKTVAIIPIKSNSKRVKNKNFRIINGKPLYSIILKTVKKSNFDEIYVDSDSNEIEKFCNKESIKFLKRVPKLAKDSANGNDLLNYHAKIIKADIYFQIFITSPLMTTRTINRCIEILKRKKYNSIFTAEKIYSWFWFKNKPVNYSPKVLPRSQDAIPIIKETTGLYGIKRKTLLKEKCRIGNKPYFYFVKRKEETIDLDTEEDFNYLRYNLKKK